MSPAMSIVTPCLLRIEKVVIAVAEFYIYLCKDLASVWGFDFVEHMPEILVSIAIKGPIAVQDLSANLQTASF